MALSADRMKDHSDAKASAGDMGNLLGDPRFGELIQEIEQAPPDQRAQVAGRLLHVAELRRRGIPVPPGTKLKLRAFDVATGNDLASSEEQT